MIERILIASLVAFTAFCLNARCETIDGSDGRITYIGRTEVKGGSVSFDWTGVYLRVKFQGNSLSVKVSDSKKDYYNVWLDSPMTQKADKVVAVHGSDSTIVLFSTEELKARFGKDRKALQAPHQVIIQKRTEGSQGTTTIHEFSTDGTFLQADAQKGRVI